MAWAVCCLGIICCYEVGGRTGRRNYRAVRVRMRLVSLGMAMGHPGDMCSLDHGHPICRVT